MTIDIQVISVVDDLQVIGQQEIEGADPRAIRLVGSGGFVNAQRIIINDFGIDSFLVVSDFVILVNPGPTLDAVPVEQMDIVVVASQLTNTRKARLFFGPTKRLKRVSGVQKLIQHVVKILLSNSNSNKFQLSEGGNLLRLTGLSLSSASKSRIASNLSQAVSATEEQLTAAQSGATGLASDERLLSLSLGDVTFNEETLEVIATIRMVTFAGRNVSVPLIL